MHCLDPFVRPLEDAEDARVSAGVRREALQALALPHPPADVPGRSGGEGASLRGDHACPVERRQLDGHGAGGTGVPGLGAGLPMAWSPGTSGRGGQAGLAFKLSVHLEHIEKRSLLI